MTSGGPARRVRLPLQRARPHRSLDLDQPLLRPATSTTGNGKVIRRDVLLGGIIHEYERAA